MFPGEGPGPGRLLLLQSAGGNRHLRCAGQRLRSGGGHLPLPVSHWRAGLALLSVAVFHLLSVAVFRLLSISLLLGFVIFLCLFGKILLFIDFFYYKGKAIDDEVLFVYLLMLLPSSVCFPLLSSICFPLACCWVLSFFCLFGKISFLLIKEKKLMTK